MSISDNYLIAFFYVSCRHYQYFELVLRVRVIASYAAFVLRVTVPSHYLYEERPNMRRIAIVPRPGHEVGKELHAALSCLRNVGIHAHSAIIGRACALVWVDDEQLLIAIETLRNDSFQATTLTETDVAN
jgi:hypothetical protein